MPKSIIETNVEGEVFTHRILWSTCQRQLRVARNDPNGSWYFYLTAMLMAFMTFEAYINYLGTKLAPDIWKDERNNFRSPPYKGTSGKLLKLCELYNVAFPTKGGRPYQSVVRLNNLRDIIAHGKPDEFEITIRHPVDKNPALIKYNLDEFVSDKKAEQAIADTKELIDKLNGDFLSVVGPDVINSVALDGVLAFSSGNMDML
jgi:hypothetical protein